MSYFEPLESPKTHPKSELKGNKYGNNFQHVDSIVDRSKKIGTKMVVLPLHTVVFCTQYDITDQTFKVDALNESIRYLRSIQFNSIL